MTSAGAVAKLGREPRRPSFSHFLMAAACRRFQAVSKTRLTITASGFGCLLSNIAPCPFRNEYIASIPFVPRIRFSRPWSPSRMVLRYFTYRCSTIGGQIPSDFNSAIALAREGALSVLNTLGYPADRRPWPGNASLRPRSASEKGKSPGSGHRR